MFRGQFSDRFIIFCDGDFAVASGNAGQTALPVEDGDLVFTKKAFNAHVQLASNGTTALNDFLQIKRDFLSG